MTLLDDLIEIEDDFAVADPDFGIQDRGEIYLRIHDLTNSEAAAHFCFLS